MASAAPSIADTLRRLRTRTKAGAAAAGELTALKRYPRRLMLACGAVLSLLSISVLVTLIVVQVNSYEARRIAEFRRAHNALQIQLGRQDASYARLANMAEYAWGRNIQLGQDSPEALRTAYLQGDQRLVVVADDASKPQMALGLATTTWAPRTLERYLELSAAVSLIQRLTSTPNDGEPASVSYFFDPSGQYLSLDKGLTERSLREALAVTSRAEVFEHLRAPAHLLAPASSVDQMPLLESVASSNQPRRTFGRHPISGEASLVSVFQASEGGRPFATFVAYEPVAGLQALLARNSQGYLSLLDRGGLRLLCANQPAAARHGPGVDRDWVLLGDATRARYHNGRFTLALAVEGTPWTLVETYCWADILRGITPMLLSSAAMLLGGLVLLWGLLLWLHRRMYSPALRQVKAIYARDRRLRLLLEHVPVGVALMDAATGDIQDWNGPLQDMDRATGSRLIRRLRAAVTTTDLSNGPVTLSEDLPQVLDHGQRLFHRTRLYCGNGSWPGSVLLIVEDISDHVRAIQHEQVRWAEAEAGSHAKSNFVAAMSHELRTPLHGIIGHLELLGRAPLPAEASERVLRLRQSADALMDVITDVLDLSRIESGQWALHPERFSPVAMLERVALLYAPVAQAKGLQLDCVVDPGVPTAVVAPMGTIERVLRNLASNALKFTASGRVQLRVSCLRGEGGSHLRLEVTDSGIGLSADECARLFQPFVQADASILQRFGGSGLGLALCQQLCECMGGRIWVESTQGVGSRFIAEAPLLGTPSVRPSVPLQGHSIGLLASAGPWRDELGRRLQDWGAQVQYLSPLEHGAPPVAGLAAIVLFEPAPDQLLRLAERGIPRVLVSRDGPVRARWDGQTAMVSCYASNALYQAVQRVLPTPAPSLTACTAIG
ncbi:MAG: two-component sensor histidine kinase [Stenotrophomonas maltophilia]|uniref:sensor histidine kinase n=1 Tax=Stenotrophomonas TaxID=40323 RepID=UPI0013107B8D|nr:MULTISPECIES: ATP-binding protein [Stenotrophomonas]MBS4799533.1 two-component sensor histidine kinase [Stenotrophomonas maltophilia]MDG9988014.1 ATP-binding protein [Stenotrophomonas sp. GD04024]